MFGREVVVIIGWVGLEQEALCGNGKIPLGSLGLRLITSAILLVGLGVAVWEALALWLREGYGGCLLFWYGGRFNSIREMVQIRTTHNTIVQLHQHKHTTTGRGFVDGSRGGGVPAG